MNPTKYYSFAGLLAVHILLFSMSASGVAEAVEPDVKLLDDGNGGFVLDELVVRRQANIENVNLEQDGSFSLLSSSPAVVYSALNSGTGAAVNFEISFARHSIVMTADGQKNMEDIARALTLIGSQTAFKLVIHRFGNQDPSGRKKLTQSRANVIANRLRNNYRINSDLSIGYESKPKLIKSDVGSPVAMDLLGLTVVNLGKN